MARYDCERCGEACFTTNPEHVCKDIRKRLARREKQRNAVLGIIRKNAPWRSNKEVNEAIADEVVLVLSNMGVEDD